MLKDGCMHASNSHVVPTYRNRAGDPVQDCEKPVGEWNVAEVGKDGVSAVVEENVSRFDVAVDDSSCVQGVKPCQHVVK